MDIRRNLAKVFLRALKYKAARFEEDTKNPIKAQEAILAEFLSRNKNTEYGSKCNFAGIKTISDYQTAVPLVDSEKMHEYLKRLAAGENGILTSDKVIFFGATSGTTGKPKWIPVTAYSKAKKTELMDLWSYYIYRDHPNVLDGKILAIISPEEEGRTSSGMLYGAESGHEYKNLPIVIKNLYSIPYCVFEIADYMSRYYVMLRITMEENISTIATLNPSTLVLMCGKISQWSGRIIDDIKNGTLNNEFDIDPTIRKEIEKNLKPNTERAAELKSIIDKTGALLPKDFWPNLELIECWKGGTVKLYLKDLPKYFGDIPTRDLGCLSTEARSSIPLSDEQSGGVLAINTNFYEFMPYEDMNKDEKRFLLCDQLEAGKQYFIIVTTPGGLYRYNIDDLITVSGYFNKTPIIEFLQKGKNAVSMTGEKLYEYHVNEAVNCAAAKHGMIMDFFSACGELGNPARYIFLVEFHGGNPPREKEMELLRSIEGELYRQNLEYECLRKQGLLGAPVLKVLKKGEFEKYKIKKIDEGMHDAQFKAPKLSRDFDFPKNFQVEEEIGLF